MKNRKRIYRLLADSMLFLTYSILYIFIMGIACIGIVCGKTSAAGRKLWKQRNRTIQKEKSGGRDLERKVNGMEQLFLNYPIGSTITYQEETYRVTGYEVYNGECYIRCDTDYGDFKINVNNL